MGFKPMKKHGQDGRATLLDTKFRTAPVILSEAKDLFVAAVLAQILRFARNDSRLVSTLSDNAKNKLRQHDR